MRELPRRKTIRLKNYDYGSEGVYFITICVKDGYNLLGEINTAAFDCHPDVGAIRNRPQTTLSEHGKTVNLSIKQISDYSDTHVDKYVIMPNHVHMILFVRAAKNVAVIHADEDGGRLRIAPTDISVTVQQFKRRVSKAIGFSMWQKSYHDHVIRNEDEYRRIWQYIDENPARWQDDCYYIKGQQTHA